MWCFYFRQLLALEQRVAGDMGTILALLQNSHHVPVSCPASLQTPVVSPTTHYSSILLVEFSFKVFGKNVFSYFIKYSKDYIQNHKS